MKSILALSLAISLLGSASCLVVTPKHDNGKHKGWYKNPKNPHNPANNGTPGNGNGNGKGKPKKK
jgi:hypothetical protein